MKITDNMVQEYRLDCMNKAYPHLPRAEGYILHPKEMAYYRLLLECAYAIIMQAEAGKFDDDRR